MIFCERCFSDTEIIPIIRGLGQKGTCQICGCSDVYTYDTEKNVELIEYFGELIDIYTPSELLPSEYPQSEVKLLKDELLINWDIFNNRSPSDVYKIISNLCVEKYEETPELFKSSVGISELYNKDYLSKNSLLRTNSWYDFVEAVKTKNRFHSNYLNLEKLEKYCSFIRKTYKAGTAFYRARISSEDGFNTTEMGAPLSDKASAGRANALGIRCLYLGDSVDTTIHEVRAGAYDYISVGRFELQEAIVVVDFKRINKISPFIDGLDYKEHAIDKEHLNKINDEMGKALRRSDSILDYVPTQYISDFIKSIMYDGKSEYSGLEYNSVMNKGGYNLAIFNPELFKCVDVKTYKISDLKYFKDLLR